MPVPPNPLTPNRSTMAHKGRLVSKVIFPESVSVSPYESSLSHSLSPDDGFYPVHRHGHLPCTPEHAFEVIPNSATELELITLVLPYTPHLNMPLHPQRLLSRLSLPITNQQRPRPALLYILFAEAIRILENNIPTPTLPGLFAPMIAVPPTSTISPTLMDHVRGKSLSCLEKAKYQLDLGIRNGDRLFDLARAATGTSRYLFTIGRFLEAWTIPVVNLHTACGLDRSIGTPFTPKNATLPQVSGFPQSAYPSNYGRAMPRSTIDASLPIPPDRLLGIPPPQDEIDVAERKMAFCATKMQVWSASLQSGWTSSIPDEEGTTEWCGHGGVEVNHRVLETIRSLCELIPDST